MNKKDGLEATIKEFKLEKNSVIVISDDYFSMDDIGRMRASFNEIGLDYSVPVVVLPNGCQFDVKDIDEVIAQLRSLRESLNEK